MPISHLLPLFSATWVFGLGVFVLSEVIFGQKRSKANFLFSLFCFGTTFWLFGTFMMFRSTTDKDAIFWDRFLYIAAILNPILLYHFGRALLEVKEKKWLLWLGYLLAAFFLIISRTDYFLANLYKYDWGVHTKAQIFHHPFLVYFIVYVNLFLLTILKGLKSAAGEKRIQLKYIFAALVIMAVVGCPAFLPAYGIDVFPFSYLSGAIFAVITAYAITQHRFLSHVLATDILVVLILVFLLPPLIFPEFEIGFLGKAVFTALMASFGFLLTRSVRKEMFYSEQIKEAYEDLKKLDEAKSEFISIASHQLRTPLSAIKGYISLIIDGTYGAIPPKAKTPIEKVYQANERLIKLVSDLLTVSRIEAGKMQMELKKNSLEELMVNAIEVFKIVAQKKGLYLKLEKPAKTLPLIIFDKEKINQVILNIIDNAIHYTEEGGVNIKLKMKSDERTILIGIEDTGVGMERNEIEEIFARFSRGEDASKHWTEGAGLGLYIAKKFVEMHRGKIWVESAGKSKGSIFYIELPIN